MNGAPLVLRQTGFFSTTRTEALHRRMEALAPDATGVRSFGDVLGVALASSEGREVYLARAEAWNRAFAELFAPGESPLTRLVRLLGAAWPGGVAIGRVGGRPMLGATIRAFEAGACLPPHVDRACEPALAGVSEQRRLAANVYLVVDGGELQLWTTPLSELEARGLVGPRGEMRAECLGEPDHVERPSEGDLLVFDTAWVHAVAPTRGPRLTASTFIGRTAAASALQLFA